MNFPARRAPIAPVIICLVIGSTAAAWGADFGPRCDPKAAGGTAMSATPTLLATLSDRWHEAWVGSPAVADLGSTDRWSTAVP